LYEAVKALLLFQAFLLRRRPVTSWIDSRSIQSERANLTILFDKYVPTCLEAVKAHFKTITPVPDNTMIQVNCM